LDLLALGLHVGDFTLVEAFGDGQLLLIQGVELLGEVAGFRGGRFGRRGSRGRLWLWLGFRSRLASYRGFRGGRRFLCRLVAGGRRFRGGRTRRGVWVGRCRIGFGGGCGGGIGCCRFIFLQRGTFLIAQCR